MAVSRSPDMAAARASFVPAEGHIETASVGLLYRHPWLLSLLVGVTASVLTGYMFMGHVATSWIVAWLLLINSVIMTRVGLIIVFAHVGPAQDRYPAWGRYYLVLAWLNGLAWGLPAFALDSSQLTLVFFYSLVIGAFVAGAIPGLSFNIAAFYGFTAFATLPLIARLLLWEEPFFRLLGVLSLLFVAINTASAKISNRRIGEQILLEFENSRLVDYLKAEKERAEQANLVKTRFLAAASHDLRQPLHAMGLFVDALDTRDQLPESRQIIRKLKLSTHSLSELLNSMLDISKLDAGVARPDVFEFKLTTLLAQLASEFGPQAAGKGLDLRIRASDAWVRSDPLMLTRILRNLLSNAVCYTRTGGVLVACRRRAGKIRIDVYDTGPGIPADELPGVFEEFYRLDNTGRDHVKGLGLGLAIVRRLAALLHHELDVRSRTDRGSVFSISIDAAATVPPKDAEPRSYRGDLAGTLVVVIDDEAQIRDGMSATLRNWGCRTIVSDSAADALRQLADDPLVPDLIVADYRLRAGETGLQAIDRIRVAVDREVPAILVTGDIAPERLREARACGCQLIHKPVAAASLRSLAGYLIEKASAETGV